MVQDQEMPIHVCPYRPDATLSYGLPAAHPVHLWPTTATYTGAENLQSYSHRLVGRADTRKSASGVDGACRKETRPGRGVKRPHTNSHEVLP